MKLLLFTATLGLTAAFNASLDRRTPSRRTLAALKASQMESFERAVECAGKIRDQMSRADVITYPLLSLIHISQLNNIYDMFAIIVENFGYCNLDELETLAAGKFEWPRKVHSLVRSCSYRPLLVLISLRFFILQMELRCL